MKEDKDEDEEDHEEEDDDEDVDEDEDSLLTSEEPSRMITKLLLARFTVNQVRNKQRCVHLFPLPPHPPPLVSPSPKEEGEEEEGLG